MGCRSDPWVQLIIAQTLVVTMEIMKSGQLLDECLRQIQQDSWQIILGSPEEIVVNDNSKVFGPSKWKNVVIVN